MLIAVSHSRSFQMLWLKNHMPSQLFSSCMFFDLPDWLSYRATSDLARSNCSLACKCSYVPPGVEGSKGWNDEFFKEIGLEEFVSLLSLNSFPPLEVLKKGSLMIRLRMISFKLEVFLVKTV